MIYTLAADGIAPKKTKVFFATYMYRVSDDVVGSINKDEIRALRRKKIILPETPIFCPATEAWHPYSAFPDFPKPSLRRFIRYHFEPHFEPIISLADQLIDDVVACRTYAYRAMDALRKAILEHGYTAPEYDLDTLNDLTSHERIKLIVDTNVESRHGARQAGYNAKNRLYGTDGLLLGL